MYWNACWMNAHRQAEVSGFITENKISLCGIAEARLPSAPKGFGNYHCFQRGLLAVFAHKDLKFKLLDEADCKQAHCLSMGFEIGKIVYILCYLPNGGNARGIKKLIDIYYEVRKKYRKICIIGDMNLRSYTTMPHKKRNASGKAFDDFLEDNAGDVMCLNGPEWTFKRINHPPSVLDLVVISASCAQHINGMKVLDQFDSDHRPIVLNVKDTRMDNKLISEYQELFPIRASNLIGKKDHDFEGFRERFQKRHDKTPFLLLESAAEIWSKMYDMIVKSLKDERLLRPPSKSKVGKCWFNQEIKDLIKKRNIARIEDEKEYVVLKKEVKKVIRREKRRQFDEFLKRVNCQDSIQATFRMFRMFCKDDPVFKTGGDSVIQANAIAAMFKEHTTCTMPKNVVMEAEYRYISENWELEDVSRVNQRIELDEVISAIRRTKAKSAPGPDGIPYLVFKNLPVESLSTLCQVFNKWFDNCTDMETVDIALQIALAKADIGKYRGITLSNAIRKVFENVLNARLTKWAEDKLPKYQFGFREGLSPEDQALRLLTYLEDCQSKKNHCVVLFTDIRKAYDRVDRKTLMVKLHRLGLKGKMLRIINRLIQSASIRVVHEYHVSESYRPVDGIPQGSVLSCLLWNLYFADLPLSAEDDFQAAFADDLAIVTTGKSLTMAYRKMSKAYSKIRRWARSNRIEFNNSKVKSLTIYAKGSRKKLNLEYADESKKKEFDAVLYHCTESGGMKKVQKVERYKYLGIYIDDILSLTPWMESISKEIRRRVDFIKRLMDTMQVSRKQGEQLYTAYVRGYMKYGMSIWGVKTKNKKILSADRYGLRVISGMLSGTPTAELEEESSLPRIEDVIKRTILRYCVRVRITDNDEMRKTLRRGISGRSKTMRRILKVWADAKLGSLLRQRETWKDILAKIEAYAPRKKKRKKWKYFNNFWLERLLARCRVKTLPTRKWAHVRKLAASPLCRHCNKEHETIQHLFGGNCVALDYKGLPPDFKFNIDDAFAYLKSDKDIIRNYFETTVVNFVKRNKLFRL